ncbi:phosphoribosylformylglycinamidine cyclo-ligase [bacterium]|nr:phosphoribosylformylglycinamidine cyclo-ligase [bacterium]
MDYRSAGVDISKADRLLIKIKQMLGNSGSQIGHFGGTAPFPAELYKEPLLVSSIDGAGTKTAVAAAMNKHDGIGRDLLHHSINDIACCGAEPISFMDYFAMGELDIDLAVSVIGGLIDACRKWNITLTGGETAEMPGVYRDCEYDLVGSITGVVERNGYIDGSTVEVGDVLIGFPSTGLHTNGYSLERRIINETDLEYETFIPELGMSVGEALLAEHRCYLYEIRELKRSYAVKGLAHITGGGLPGNVSRILPAGCRARFDWGTWECPPIFNLLREKGNVPEDDMRRTFNLGVGLVAVLAPDNAQLIETEFPKELYSPFRVGEVITG